jgi:hypothetical protein
VERAVLDAFGADLEREGFATGFGYPRFAQGFDGRWKNECGVWGGIAVYRGFLMRR